MNSLLFINVYEDHRIGRFNILSLSQKQNLVTIKALNKMSINNYVN